MKSWLAGECYFRLSFLDPAKTRPVVDTLVFIGMNLSEEDKEDTWYFQDAHSYNVSGPVHESEATDAQIFCYTKGSLAELLDLTGLSREIQNIASRRGDQSS